MEITKLEGYELAGRFKLKHLLGQGGYGAVFEAEQLSMGRTCAVKVLVPHLTSDEATVKRFKREARSTSRLAHPNTIVIYDFGVDDDVKLLFLAMEFLKGKTLNQLVIEDGPLDVETAIHVLEQAASSLDDAAEAGIVHRDIKPHNIMVTRRGNDDYYVKVIDFGIAKALKGNDPNRITNMELTQTGTIVGTPQYMSPEQIRDEELDGRSDQYSLAVCVYKMLIGQTPFTGSSAIDVATRHLTDKALPLTSFNSNLPVGEEFESVVLRALSKDRNERYATSTDFAAALRHAWESGARPERAPAQETADIRVKPELPTPPSGSIGVASPSGSIDAAAATDADSVDEAPTEPVPDEVPAGETTTASIVDIEEPSEKSVQALSDAPELTGAIEPDFDSEAVEEDMPSERDGVRVAGEIPALDLPDAPGHTVQLDSVPEAPLDTAAIVLPKTSRDDSKKSFPWLIAVAMILVGFGLLAVVVTQLGADGAENPEIVDSKSGAETTETKETPNTRGNQVEPIPAVAETADMGSADASAGERLERAEKSEEVKAVESERLKSAAVEENDQVASAELANVEKKEEEAREDEVKYGKVTVTLMPWGELWVGRRNYGDKERQTLRLKAGRHRLRLRQNGETRASKTVDVEPGRSTMVVLKAK